MLVTSHSVSFISILSLFRRFTDLKRQLPIFRFKNKGIKAIMKKPKQSCSDQTRTCNEQAAYH